MGKGKKGGSPKDDRKSLRPGGMPPPKSPPDDPTEWKPFGPGLKDPFNLPDDDDPNSSPSSGNGMNDDEITDINLTFGKTQGSGVDTLKRFQPDVCDKNIAITRDTFQQFTIKIPRKVRRWIFIHGYFRSFSFRRI